MIKKFNLFDWQYWVMISLSILLLITIVNIIININNAHIDSTYQVGLYRLGACIAPLILYFYNYLKNKILKLTINEDILSFYIIKNFKRQKININRKDLIACKMYIYTAIGTRICLNFEIRTDNERKFIDIYCDKIPLNIIKQLFVIKEYITNFTYDISPENTAKTNYIKSYIENGMKYSLKDNVYNLLITIALIIGLVITVFCIINL